ncbi:MAG: AraC family transcriptional regulator [Bacilli bacterium]|nr:AraC family transcriptional regulator [Bacilli bacterium]MCX4255024.1 AraC family transcriptional regulator [Bacilli bacterium]
MTLLLDKKMALIDVANLCGFYDQAHFIKTIKRYTSISPLKLISIYNL